MNEYLRNDEDIENTINEYADLLYRTSFLILRNRADVEDIVQETFYKYMTTEMAFDSDNHKRAWLLKVSQNKCKDLLRSHKIRAYVPYEEVEESLISKTDVEKNDIEELLKIEELDYKYMSVIMLYYYEEYSIEEVANILDLSVVAVKKRLQRAREKVKKSYETLHRGGENYGI